MRRTLLAALLAAASGGCFAETWAVASVASYHLHRAGQNEFNLGAGLERDLAERWRAVAGGYNNSSGDASFYAGAVYSHTRIGRVRLGTLVAVVTGYEKSPCLLAAPVLSIEGRSLGVNFGLIPGAGGVFFLQLKLRLD